MKQKHYQKTCYIMHYTSHDNVAVKLRDKNATYFCPDSPTPWLSFTPKNRAAVLQERGIHASQLKGVVTRDKIMLTNALVGHVVLLNNDDNYQVTRILNMRYRLDGEPEYFIQSYFDERIGLCRWVTGKHLFERIAYSICFVNIGDRILADQFDEKGKHILLNNQDYPVVMCYNGLLARNLGYEECHECYAGSVEVGGVPYLITWDQYGVALGAIHEDKPYGIQHGWYNIRRLLR